MTGQKRAERDAVTRLRAASLDLIAAKRFTESNDVLAIIERIEPRVLAREGAPVAPRPQLGAARSDPDAIVPPVASGPATYRTVAGWPLRCSHCDQYLAAHCTTHLLPCCPGSLMHGQDEGTWTPNTVDDR